MTYKTAILGCGYIGMGLLKLWKNKKDQLIVTTTTQEREQELQALASEVKVLRANDESNLYELLKKCNRLIICISAKHSSSYREAYLQTAETIKKVLEKTPPLKHLIYTSSTSVYGDHNGNWVTEDSPLFSMGENNEILKQTEFIYLYKIKKPSLVTIFRLSGIYGPQRDHVRRIKRMNNTFSAKTKNDYVNFIHQEDIVRAIDWAIENSLSGIYNLSADDHPTKESFYKSITKENNVSPISWKDIPPSFHSGNKRISNEKIKQKGFAFLHSTQGPLEWISLD